jgi:hypothetical protein
MSNHYHLLVETPDSNLSKGMRHLNGVFTQRFNRHHGRVGHVFQGRYKSIIVQKDNYLLELSRYIVLNPVRARMVRSARDWPWSSYRATAGQITCPKWLHANWLLSAFGCRKKAALMAYRTFVSDGKNQPSPWEQLKGQIYLGDDLFVKEMQAGAVNESDIDLSEVPVSQRRGIPKALEYYKNESANRDEAIESAYASGGYSMKQIGDYFGLHYSRISRLLKAQKARNKT